MATRTGHPEPVGRLGGEDEHRGDELGVGAAAGARITSEMREALSGPSR
jgi:hypothetical protein